MNNYLYNMFHLLFFTIVTFSNNLVADEVINFRHLTVENDGLSESTVYDVFQDSRGYVWICTDNGLNKYDGYSMDSYQYMHYDTSSISKGAPRYIFEDQKGYVWISTNAGFLNKLDLETEKVKRILPIENPMFSSLTFLLLKLV
ncbi:MAG: two-component regulator propeller domain-containing protein [Candidatus Neomarinimicrobiota bacterium]